jgi:putative SOS response-associated peptidase YedK
MCGRFAQFSVLETLQQHFPIDTVACDVRSSFNIAPTHKILTIARENDYRLSSRHWGLVPFWAKDLSSAPRSINARAETASKKPSFRNAYKNRRCLILADGFYEWQKTDNRKQPYFLTLATKNPFAFAGLWEIWEGREETRHESCTILTTEAKGYARGIHHRMPVILPPHAFDVWLDPENRDTAMLDALVLGKHQQALTGYPVSSFVNSPRNNTSRCIEAVGASTESLSLFEKPAV